MCPTVDLDLEHPTLAGPYKTKSAARAYMAEYERLARILAAID